MYFEDGANRIARWMWCRVKKCKEGTHLSFIWSEGTIRSSLINMVTLLLFSCVQLFATPWTAVHQTSLSFAVSWSLLKVISLSHWYHPTILCHPLFLWLSIFPSIRAFSSESTVCIRWPKYWSFASASVLPMNIQGWFLLVLTGLISLQFKGPSRVFSSTMVFEGVNCLVLSLLYGPAVTSIHDYWKNHSID